ILFATDDFFAPAENILKKQKPVFHAELFTDYGKSRDGWETRRRRIPGHDWCIIQLGVSGVIYGIEADTSYLEGNGAPKISVQAACLQPGEVPALPPRANRIGTSASDEECKVVKEMRSDEWTFVVPISEIKSGDLDICQNYFFVTLKQRWTHLRLNIYPDGGIARLKIYGAMLRDWLRSGPNELNDLAAMVNGGLCVGYSNAQLGHPQNILGRGRAKSMKDGWETRRNLERPPVLKVDDNGILLLSGNEWAVFRMGHPGVITHIEIDTSHFKGAKRPERKKTDEVIRPVVHSNIQVPSKWQSIYNKPRNINVFTNGDMLIPPVKILIPRFTLKSWNGVLGLVNEKVFPSSGGIHRLYTLNGQRVRGADDLEDNQFYVACGKEKFKPLPYWQHPKVPADIQRHLSDLPGPLEKPPPKKPPTEPSDRGGSVPPPMPPSKRGAGDRASVYYAKPEKASREVAPRPLSPDHGSSVYKAQQSPKDIEGAREIQEDKNIQVEIPVDQPEKDKKEDANKDGGQEGKKEEEEEEEEGKKGVFKKMFGFLFNKSKKKDGLKEDTKQRDANEQKRSHSAANDEFFDAYDYD
ncbi:hypothetical protein JRQ81_007447, partial [Phrynocephalus forsythii]